MAGHSGALFLALHHQICGLFPSCHHVPLLYNAQRQLSKSNSGVTRLSSLLASSQLGVLPGRVRDQEARFLIQAHSAFPSPPCLAIVQFKRRHLNSSNPLLGQQGPHKATEWIPGNANPIPSPQSILYQPRYTLPTAKEQNSYPTSTRLLSIAAPSCLKSSIRLSSTGQDNTDSSHWHTGKLQSMQTTEVWYGERHLMETHIPHFLPVLCHSALVSGPRMLLTHPRNGTNTKKRKNKPSLHIPSPERMDHHSKT